MSGVIEQIEIPKIWRDMVKESLATDQDPEYIDRKIVENRLIQIFATIGDFKDSALTVFEMPTKFPTGFFFQEVKNQTQ